MFEWWTFVEKDVLAIFAAFSPKDLQYPLALLLWVIVVSMPMHGVDRRDRIVGICYTLYCTATGITLFLALPEAVKSFSDVGLHLAIFSVLAAISAYRWFSYEAPQVVTKSTKDKSKPKKETPGVEA